MDMQMANVTLPHSFIQKKAKILHDLAVPSESYDDLSPKGSVDEGIRDLIDEINELEGFVTTSSCAGRVSVFLEGNKGPSKTAGNEMEGDEDREGSVGEESVGESVQETRAGVGGKGGGGRWLFVSHERVPLSSHSASLSCPEDLVGKLGMTTPPFSPQETEFGPGRRNIHFKFEPMILHILTASLSHAQLILTCAQQSGFRESGALNLISSPNTKTTTQEPATPMVAIRTQGLALESIIGYHSTSPTSNNPDPGSEICTISPSELRYLVTLANERFGENEKRIARFRELLKQRVGTNSASGGGKRGDGEDGKWEDSERRRERKRAEGLKRREEIGRVGRRADGEEDDGGIPGLGFLGEDT